MNNLPYRFFEGKPETKGKQEQIFIINLTCKDSVITALTVLNQKALQSYAGFPKARQQWGQMSCSVFQPVL